MSLGKPQLGKGIMLKAFPAYVEEKKSSNLLPCGDDVVVIAKSVVNISISSSTFCIGVPILSFANLFLASIC